MLLTRGQFGFANPGLGVMVKAGTVLKPPTSTGAATVAPEHSFANFYTYDDIKAMHIAWATERQINGAIFDSATAQALPTCPPSSSTDGGKSCYYRAGVAFEPAAAIPGVFEFASVPFNASELKDGRFDRAFKPDPDQRAIIEYYVIQRSQKVIEEKLRAALQKLFASIPGVPQFWQGFVVDTEQKRPAVMPFITGASMATDLSVGQVLGLVPDLRTRLDNFGQNPITPSDAEYNGKGGWNAWLARGGFPLSHEVISGGTNLLSNGGKAVGISYCASILCNCNGTTSCIPGYFTKDGVTLATNGANSSAFIPYIAIDQAAPFEFHLALVNDDPSWYTKVAAKLGEAMKSLFGVFCAAQPEAQRQISMAVAEKCVDAHGKICGKGSPGCKCASPPAYVQGASAAAAMAVQAWCGAFADETQPPPVWEAPTPLPTPIQATPPKWGWLVAGGVVLGAFLFAK